MSEWTFFTNHAHVLFALSEDSGLTVREVARRVGITERMTQKIIHDLERDGLLKINKRGRNNAYTLLLGRKKLKHDIEKHCKVSSLIELIVSSKK